MPIATFNPQSGNTTRQDNQQDRNQRLSIRYQSNSRLGLLSLNGGYVNDVIIYNGSSSNVIRWISSARHEFLFARTFHAPSWCRMEITSSAIFPITKNGQAKEDRYVSPTSVQKNINERFSVARKSASTGGILVSALHFFPYLGTEYAILKVPSKLKIRGSISKNYRVPTLNDRYWQKAATKIYYPKPAMLVSLV